jgi:hypothetical protein
MSQPDNLALSPATRPSWKTLLGEGDPLLVPAAHDALTVRLIARAGFKAYQVGGFALSGTRWAFPDIDLVQFYEENEAIRQIVAPPRRRPARQSSPPCGSGGCRTSSTASGTGKQRALFRVAWR